MFIGSSAEQIDAANALQVLLDHDCETTVWAYDVFEAGGVTVQSLEKRASNSDFAVFVMNADDVTVTRSAKHQTTRDNVVFELGLFVGALGHERCFMVYNRVNGPVLPSDLLGVTPAKYEPHGDGNLQSAMGAAATTIRNQIRVAGLRVNLLSELQQRETEMDGLRSDRNDAQAIKDETLGKFKVLQDKFDDLKRAKTSDEILAATLPRDEEDQFNSLVSALKSGLEDVPRFVPDGIWYQIADKVWPISDLSRYDQEAIMPIVNDGYLDFDSEESTLTVSTDFPKVDAAVNAAAELDEFLSLESRTEEFSLWFEDKYGVPMDLGKKACWNKVLVR